MKLSGDSRAILKVALYYLVVGTAIYLLSLRFDVVRQAFTLDRLQELAQGMDQGGGLPREILETGGGTSVTGAALVSLVAMMGALLVMIPVTWIYLIIKRRGGYDQSVVHALMILPVTVSGIVIIVQNSIALAFSLAGIVAAIRWRTTLEDTKDAVYVFLGIGVGLAAGVSALGLATTLSVLFNAINLVLWKLNFGNIYVDQLGRTGAMALGDVLAGPSSARTAVAVGDTDLLKALSPREVREVAELKSRMEGYLAEETADHKEKRRYAILMVHTGEVARAQAVVEPLLERMAFRWRFAEVLPGKDDVSVVEYLVRLHEGVTAGELLDAVRREGAGAVRAAEFRSLKGWGKKD